MPKVWLLVALPLLLVSTAARASETGYVDVDRALNECSDGKRIYTELRADQAGRDKAKAEAAKTKKAAALPTDEQWASQQTAKLNEAMKPVAARMLRILPVIMKARKLTALAPVKSMVFVAPGGDVTDELIRRYDAGEGQLDRAAELAAAEAKVAALKRELAPKPPAKGK